MIDLIIVIAFIIYAISAGFRSQKKASKSLQEYFLAGKTLTGWRVGLSMAATQFAADTPLLVTGLIATGGVFLVWRLWIYGIAFLMMGFIFSVGWRRSCILTDAEFTEIRYSGKAVLPPTCIKSDILWHCDQLYCNGDGFSCRDAHCRDLFTMGSMASGDYLQPTFESNRSLRIVSGERCNRCRSRCCYH